MCEANGCDPGLVCASGYCVEDSNATSEVTLYDGPDDADHGERDRDRHDRSHGRLDDHRDPAVRRRPGRPQQCPETAPYRLAEGVCADCSGLTSCADVDAAKPACDAASALCVECTEADASVCGGNTPVCDLDANACSSCVAHEQCPSGACNIATGACFEDSLWVDRQATCGGDGSEENPFCEIQDAIATIGTDTPTLVRVRPGPSAYGDSRSTSAATASWRSSARAGRPRSTSTSTRCSSTTTPASTSRTCASSAARCRPATAWCASTPRCGPTRSSSRRVSRWRSTRSAAPCRSGAPRLYATRGGGIKVEKGTTRIENTFVTSNGGNFSAVRRRPYVVSGELDVVYATIIGNNSDGTADSLHCDDPGSRRPAQRRAVRPGRRGPGHLRQHLLGDSIVDSNLLAGRGVTVEVSALSAWFKGRRER